jgi:hypothetical protein
MRHLLARHARGDGAPTLVRGSARCLGLLVDAAFPAELMAPEGAACAAECTAGASKKGVTAHCHFVVRARAASLTLKFRSTPSAM